MLAYDYRLIDGNGNGMLENGEQAEIEIVTTNKGEMEARDITLSVDSADLEFENKRHSIARIRAAEEYNPLRFSFTVPRTLEKDSLALKVHFEQKDFTGLTDQIHLPIHLVVPQINVSHQVLDGNNNGAIEQGETVDVIVRVRNTGKLDAHDVKLRMSIAKAGVNFQGDPSVHIGRLAAGMESSPHSYRLYVTRQTEPGSLPITFAVSQRDFSTAEQSVALDVVEEKAEVISVAAKEVQNAPISPVAVAAAAGIPPMVFIATPQNQIRVARDHEILQGIVGDDKAVANVQVTVNGQRMDTTRDIAVRPKGGTEKTKRNFRIKIPLQVGRNDVVVTAFDIDNLSSSENLTIFREAEKGEIYAAVIGINQYQHGTRIPALRYARNDAEAFAGYMRQEMGLDSAHLFELYDDQATKRNIESLLGTQLRRKAQSPEDTVIIFFAGHGAPESDAASNDPDGITKYILAHDADPDDLFSTAIAMDQIATIFSRIRAERVVFIADSCYSGGSGGRTLLAANRRANISDAFLERIARAGKGRIILTSSNAQEVSQESDKCRHGYFTYYLLEGLRGKADISQDGEIDIDEIYR
jgi:hypothetical protein